MDVTLEYVQELTYTNGEFELGFPLTFTPRFGAPARRPAPASTIAAQVPHAQLEARLRLGFPLDAMESPSHEVQTWWEGETLVVQPSYGGVVTDRDFVLRWRPPYGPYPPRCVGPLEPWRRARTAVPGLGVLVLACPPLVVRG